MATNEIQFQSGLPMQKFSVASTQRVGASAHWGLRAVPKVLAARAAIAGALRYAGPQQQLLQCNAYRSSNISLVAGAVFENTELS